MRRPATQTKPPPTREPAPAMIGPRFPVWLLAVVLVLVTLALYWRAAGCDFVNYDDDLYVTSNVHVRNGLTWEAVKWACLNPVADNWHPLTVLSHIFVCQVFGLTPWGSHVANVLLHALNAALVFALLRRLTGATWRSLWVAALFAIHPLRVESVAWVSERKDVLSGFFGLLALIAYARYAEGKRQQAASSKQKPEGRGSGLAVRGLSPIFYLLCLLFFALGLMSKPMLVTWPFVMLLLDYWSLGRLDLSTLHAARSTLWRLVREKAPFFLLAALGSVVTFVVQKRGSSLRAAEHLPLAARAANALVSYCRHLGKLFWPTEMAVYYPHPGQWPLGTMLLAGGLLLGLSVLFWVGRRRFPYMLVGWLWFVGMLVPVIGLVQTGGQAMADRHTYLPSLGVLIMVVWGLCELAQSCRYQVLEWLLAGGAVLLLCAALTRQQIGYWRDSETLFRHALEVTENNDLAHNNLGAALGKKGDIDEAIRQFQEAIRLKPNYAAAHNNLGIALGKQGRSDEALSQFQEALRLNPDGADAHKSLGNALSKKGQIDEAIRQYQEALRLKPDDADAHYNLGNAFGRKGQSDEAIRQFQEAIRLKPDDADAHNDLGNALDKKGQSDEAIRQYREAILLRPDQAELRYNFGLALGKKGQSDEAIRQFQEAIRLKPDLAEAHNNLGVAFYQQGHRADAIREFQEAVRLKPDYADARRHLEAALATRADSSKQPGAPTNP